MKSFELNSIGMILSIKAGAESPLKGWNYAVNKFKTANGMKIVIKDTKAI